MRPSRIFEGIHRLVISGCHSRRHAWRIIVLIPFFLLAMGREIHSQVAGHPDLVLHSGKIVTVDNAFRVVEAVAITGDRVSAVGRNQDVLPLIGPTTRAIDLEGRTVLPGIIDTHSHLMDYALYHTAPEAAPEVANFHELEGPGVRELLAELSKRIQKDLGEKKEPWLFYIIRPGKFDSSVQFGEQVDRRELDRLSPERPLLILPYNTDALVNSAGLEALKEHFPLQALEAEFDANGEPTGRLGDRARPALELVVPPVRRVSLSPERRAELLARAYKKELEEWAAYGVTTWASKLDEREYAAFALLDRQGGMTLRQAFSLEGVTPERAEKLGDTVKATGSPYLWMTGIYGSSADGNMARGMCTTLPSPVKHQEECFLMPKGARWNTVYESVRHGLRIGGFHAHGDLAVDHILTLIEQASKAAGMTTEQIRQKRHAIDHCALNPRPDQIAKAVQLGIAWTCSSKYIIRADIAAKRYDPEKVARWAVPLKSMIQAGLRPAFHTDGHDGGPMLFLYLQTMLTRKDEGTGRIWNLQEAIDRKDALRSATRWGAEYVRREDDLGSIEAGKWADMIVIDRDYLSIPAEEIGRIQVIMTMVGGKIVYQRP